MTTKITAALYSRVSTQDKQHIDMQDRLLRDYCSTNSITIIDTYQDVGESGSKESRPEFDRMLTDMRAGKFNTMIVHKLDRIGRSLTHLLSLFAEFQKKGINFISITQALNTTTPEGRMFLHLLMVLAEYERELIVSRVNAGVANAKAKGIHCGRPKGSKDKKVRRKSGYNMRWVNEGKKKVTLDKT